MAVSLRTDWVPMQAPPSKAATAAGAHGQPFHGDLLPHTFSDFPFLDDFLFDEALLGLLLDDPPPPLALLPGSLAGATARPAVAPPTSACPTAQSVAARLRRRRISEKTRELAQLIPGGPRMTTAEMLLAARNYVKFLQAQLGLLGLAGSSSPGSPAEELTRRLVASPAVQEKLAGVEKCLFPCGAVEAMRADPEIGSRPFILRGLGGLTSPAG